MSAVACYDARPVAQVAQGSTYMSDQASAEPTQAAEASAPAPAEAQPAAAQSGGDLEALKKELAAARKEAAKYRTRNDEETAARLKEQGDFKTLYEKESIDRQQHREMKEYLEGQLEQVNADGMPDYLKTALDAMPSVVGKVRLINQYNAAQGAAKVQSAPVKQALSPAGQPPAAPGAPDVFASVADDPAALRAARMRDPAGFAEFVAKHTGRQKPQTTWQRMRDAAAAAAKK